MLAGAEGPRYALLALGAAALAVISVAIAFIIGIAVEERIRALGCALGLWLTGTVLWDGLLLFGTAALGDRPIEGPLLVLLALNPYDVVRVVLLLSSDGASMLGATGAAVQHGLGTGAGRAALSALLLLWIAVPYGIARRVFARKDF